MKFKIGISDSSGEWMESYDEATVMTEAQATEFARKAVMHFNDTLRPKERPRVFTGKVELVGAGKGADHDWCKQNLFTQSGRRGTFDNMRCSRCGVTARRYGLGHFKRSSQFRAKKYAFCSGEPL